jgi:membrane-associated protein
LNVLLPTFLSWIQAYGYPALWLSTFIAAIGAPLPMSLMLLAAGAFAAFGNFNVLILLLITTSASVAGDNVGYIIGRLFGKKLLDWLARQKQFGLLSPTIIMRSQAYFQQRGGMAIFLSRCLVSALGSTINLLAGSELYPYHKFLIYDASGELIGAAIPLTLGYIFSASWEALGDMLTAASFFVLALLLAVYLMLLLLKSLKRIQAQQGRREPRSTGKESSTEETPKKRLDSLPL